MIEPLRLSYEIRCAPEHAFDVWTSRLSAWWPAGHSASGDPKTVALMDARLGGRIFERTADGREIDWGQITRWEPPRLFSYSLHIGRDSSQATEVALTFVDLGRGTTRLDIVHTGWERLGAEGQQYRDANTSGWSALIPSFVTAAEAA